MSTFDDVLRELTALRGTGKFILSCDIHYRDRRGEFALCSQRINLEQDSANFAEAVRKAVKRGTVDLPPSNTD